MGLESQFYFLSDIGESALVLPLEASFYWASTNNGDDNQYYTNLVNKHNGDHVKAFLEAIKTAPYGAKALRITPTDAEVESSRLDDLEAEALENESEEDVERLDKD